MPDPGGAHSKSHHGSLNEDPHNLCAEQLALEICARAFGGARRTWSEQEMVCGFSGQISPGTPDGMFEDSSGSLVCIQVVRVPLTPRMSLRSVADMLYDTVLIKVAKSQAWMRCSRTVPHEFVIFCWLPQTSHLKGQSTAAGKTSRALPRLDVITRHVGATQVSQSSACAWRCKGLVQRVRSQGWPFSLWLAMPAEPDELFPPRFGSNHVSHRQGRVFNEANLSAFVPEDFEDESEAMEWDVFAVQEEDGEEDEAAAEDEEEHDRARQNPADALAAQQHNFHDLFRERPVRTDSLPHVGTFWLAGMSVYREKKQEAKDETGEEVTLLRATMAAQVSLLLHPSGCWLVASRRLRGARSRPPILRGLQTHGYGLKEHMRSGIQRVLMSPVASHGPNIA